MAGKVTQLHEIDEKLQATIDNMQALMPKLKQVAEFKAQTRKTMFDAYIACGFNTQQALEMVMNDKSV